MKLTVATSILASSIAATAEPLHNTGVGSFRDVINDANHRSLASSMNSQDKITAILQERRALKKENGGVIRRLQRKLKRSKLRNVAEDGDIYDADLDLGFLSRNLQQNSTETNEDNVMQQLADLCSGETYDSRLSCSCSNIDVDAYTADVFCSYDEYCLSPVENSCEDNVTFCFVETYELEVLEPEVGSSQVCYEVNTPTTFTYCYGLRYSNSEDGNIVATCNVEIDGNQCNSCEIYFDPSGIKCNTFDCNNVDDAVASGIACGNETIVGRKIQDYLLYGALPCEGGCNICPDDGDMLNPDNTVTLAGAPYYCAQLGLAAQLGYLQDVPGDLCGALPEIVNEPCGCSGNVMTSSPIVDSTPTTNDTADDAPVDVFVDVPTEAPEEGPEVAAVDIDKTNDEGGTIERPESSAMLTRIHGIAIAATVTSIFSLMIV